MVSLTNLCVIPDEILRILSSNDPSHLRGLSLLRLPHPRSGVPSLFLDTPPSAEGDVDQLFEIHSIKPAAERSWFLNDSLVSDGKLLMMTPIDPAFILAPLLQDYSSNPHNATKYRVADDLCDELAFSVCRNHPDLEDDIRRFLSLKGTNNCYSRLCTSTEIAPQLFAHRYSEEMWLAYLQRKVTSLCRVPWQQLSKAVDRKLAQQGLKDEGKEALLALGGIQSACDLISQYVPVVILSKLKSSYDFSLLDAHLSELQAEEALRNAEVSPKDKKKKVEAAAPKRKAGAQISRGADKLKKVNTNGMSKLSAFFQKPAVA